MEKMKIEIVDGSDALRLAGHFDMNASQEFRNASRKALAAVRGKELILFMDEVDYIDSSALGMLLVLHKDASERGISVVLANCQPFIQRALTTAYFDRMFTLRNL